MPLVVDSCVLLDIALRDAQFGLSSALYLDKRRAEGLLACPVSVVEIAPQFDGRAETVRQFLRTMGASSEEGWRPQDTDVAARAWGLYVSLKRQGKTDRRPVADILIGAYASRFAGLVTRNPSHFAPFFPELELHDPSQGVSTQNQ